MIAPGRYTSGAIAVANLSASIQGLELARGQWASFAELASLAELLFLRGDLLGRIAEHDRAELVAAEANCLAPGSPGAFYLCARVAARFHRFEPANALLDRALAAGHPRREIDDERAAVLQALGRYGDALELRERLAAEAPGIRSLGALASLLAETGELAAAEDCYGLAVRADEGVSPIPCAQVLFEWGVSAMRARQLQRAEALFAEVAAILPAHVPAQGHRAEVALALGKPDLALVLVTPLLEISDDPEYRAIHAETLTARGDVRAAAEARRAAAAYDSLLARRRDAYADHAASFFMGVGNRPWLSLELAAANWKQRDTPRSRNLLAQALHTARQTPLAPGA